MCEDVLAVVKNIYLIPIPNIKFSLIRRIQYVHLFF